MTIIRQYHGGLILYQGNTEGFDNYIRVIATGMVTTTIQYRGVWWLYEGNTEGSNNYTKSIPRDMITL